MKQLLLLLSFIFLLTKNGSSQTNFGQISENQVAQTSQGAFALADVDGDNDQDLLVTGNYLGTYIAKLYKNNGSGIFTETTNPFEGVSTSSVAFADIDGDNDQDVIIMGYNNDFTRVTNLYKNDGNGNYTIVNGTPFTGGNRGAITFGDIDGDNDQDLLISAEIGATRITELYENDGNGNFTEILNTGITPVNVGEVTFEDIDNDTDLDLLITGFSDFGGVTHLYKNDGTGNFNLSVDFKNAYFSSLDIADVDNDTDKDILISGVNNNGDYFSALYINDGTTNFIEKQNTPFVGVADGSVNFADVDNDNDQDVFISGLTASGISVSKLFYNDGFGNFSEDNLNNFPQVFYNSKGFIDLDNDGDQDLIIIGQDSNSASSTSRVYLNDIIPTNYSNHPDYNALVAIYNSLGGDNWTNNTNWLDTTKPLSTWFGIAEENGRVVDLILNNNNLIGTIPSEIENLTNIKRIILGTNLISGTIPMEIGNLLDLEFLNLNTNNLEGEIPPSFSNLSKIKRLYLYNNNLTGNIPSGFSNFTSLEQLLLSNNSLEGPVPDLTGNTGLNFFWFDNNNFVFSDFENEFNTYASNVTNFIYSPQKLVGDPFNAVVEVGNSIILNANVGGSQNSYDWYRINADGSEGGFIGTGENINITINSADDYKWFYYYFATSSLVPGLSLRSQYFTLSNSPTNSPDYNALVAFYNSTNGDSWTNNTNWLDNTKPLNSWHGLTIENNRVTQLNLGSNQLAGSIPPEIGNLTELSSLGLYANQIEGNIPSEIGNLTKLTYLDLSPNRFSGSIPNEIGNLTNLEILFLNQNGLTGSIPSSFQNLTKLKYLYLSGLAPEPYKSSTYSGDFPDLTALPLESLDIRYNNFKFTDIADEFETYKTNILYFDFSPQFTIDEPLETNLSIGDDITLTLTDVPTASKTMYSKTRLVDNAYQWYKDNVVISGANQSSYTITNAQISDSGEYYCEITNSDLPELTIQRQMITLNVGTLSIQNEDLENSIAIYPNPVQNILYIKGKNMNNVDTRIYDLSGRLMFSKKLRSKIPTIDISGLNSGMYLLEIKAENKTITKRIIKQ